MLGQALKIIFGSLLRRWVASIQNPSRSQSLIDEIHLNRTLITQLLTKYALLTTVFWLSLHIVILALMVSFVAAAASFDMYGQFAGSAIFWTGIILFFTGMIVAGASALLLSSIRVSVRELLVVKPRSETHGLKAYKQVIRPFLEGLLLGIMRAPGARIQTERQKPAA